MLLVNSEMFSPSEKIKGTSPLPKSSPESIVGIAALDSHDIDIDTTVDLVLRRLRDKNDRRHGNILLLEQCSIELKEAVEVRLRTLNFAPRLFVEKGALFVEELAIGPVHEAAVSFFAAQRGAYNYAVTGTYSFPLRGSGSADHHLQRGFVNPDCSFEVWHLPPRGCPNVVVEVGDSQNVESLHHKARRYFAESDNILIVVVVKLYEKEDSGAMVVLVYHRSHDASDLVPVEGVSFGTIALRAELVQELIYITHIPLHHLRGWYEGNVGDNTPCTEPDLDTYRLVLPHHLLLAVNVEGEDVAPDFRDNAQDWSIDLYTLQTDVMLALRAVGRL